MIIALTNSELRADIPIPIARIIIAIKDERTCIRTIIRIPADMEHAPPVVEYLMINPFIILTP